MLPLYELQELSDFYGEAFEVRSLDASKTGKTVNSSNLEVLNRDTI